jgi:hypothetical protein
MTFFFPVSPVSALSLMTSYPMSDLMHAITRPQADAATFTRRATRATDQAKGDAGPRRREGVGERLGDRARGALIWLVLCAVSVLWWAWVSSNALGLLWCLGVASSAHAAEGGEGGEGAPVGVRRAALVVAAHDGGQGRAVLAHATRDAEKFAEVMQELGGVSPSDAVVILDPSAQGLRAGFEELQRRLLATPSPGQRVEVIFYYSGHSDEQGLLLGSERMGYRELRAAADAISADVRIMVLDSCSAGALTRAKGGSRQPPFLMDDASDVSGHAFLTSSSENEAAQESDVIGGSFFTHYLVTGLRGAADVSADGRVTLSEAYQFAFQETLRRTQSTRSGAQHPVYEIQLTGTSDLVLTDLRAPSATLQLAAAMEGRVFVHRDQPGAELMAELGKASGRSTALKLPAGRYVLRLDPGDGGQVGEARFAVAAGESLTLSPDALSMNDREHTVARGGEAPAVPLVDVLSKDGQYVYLPVHVGLVPFVGMNDWLIPEGMTPENAVAFNFLFGGGSRVKGVMMTGLVGWTAESVVGVMSAGIGNVSSGSMKGASMAGVFNAQSGEVTGAQWAGVANVADTITGAQMGGVTNIADEVNGAQIGLINIAGQVNGAQIGLINIADHSDAPIGLVNIIGDGIHEGMVWVSETAHVNAGLKLGGRYIYAIVSGGVFFKEGAANSDGFGSGDALFEVSAGLGGRIPLWQDRLYLDIDITQSNFMSEDRFYQEVSLARLRVGAGWRLLPHLSVFGGASLGALVQWGTDSVSLTGGPVAPYVVYEASADSAGAAATDGGYEPNKVSIFPGFYVGVGF